MQPRRTVAPQFGQAFAQGGGILGIGPGGQVGRQVSGRLHRSAQLGPGEAAVALFFGRLRQQQHQALLHRQQARPVLGAAVDLLQVEQQPRQDVARRRSLQEQAQRRLEVAFQPVAGAVGLQAFVQGRRATATGR